MAEVKKQAEIASITQAAYEDPAISDFRKQTRSFGLIARGVTADDIEQVCGALMFDYLAGKMDSTQVSGLLACVDRTLKREDQILQREEILLQARLREQTAIRLEERRSRIEHESQTGESVPR
jgi:hypothetical protein